MMKKVILFFTLFCIVTCLSGNAQALTTSQTLDNTTNPQWFLPESEFPLSSDYYRNWVEDWGWTHTVSFSINPTDTVVITGATLEIYAWDVDIVGDGFPELDEIKVGTTDGSDGVSLGNLDGLDSDWYTTTFNLATEALDEIVVNDDTGTLDVWLDISTLEPYGDGYFSPYWWVTLGNSKLTVQYDAIPIPAPGAVVLASLGAGFIGWLRKRRTL